MSGDRYKIVDQNAMYFLTFTIVDWVDVFTRLRYKEIIVDSLNYCQKTKGLVVHAWVIMSNHMHIICRAREGFKLSDIIRDFKKYTAKQIIKVVTELPESRREWLLYRFEYNGKYNKRVSKYKIWKGDNHAIQLDTTDKLIERLNYIHDNPVKSGIVTEPMHYLYSSARTYADIKGLLDIELIT